MSESILYFLEYVQTVIDLQGDEEAGITQWLAEIYQAIEYGRISDGNLLVRAAKKFDLSFWGKAQVFLGQADYQASLQNLDEAVKMYQNALSSLEFTQSQSDEQAIVLNNLGLVYQKQGKYEDARQCFEKAIALYDQAEKRQEKIHAISNLASVYDQRGNWAEAIQNYEYGIELLDQIYDKEDLAGLLNNVGVVYQKAGQLSQAEATLQRCVELLDDAGISISVQSVRVLMNLAEIYADLQQKDQAIHCFELAIRISQELHNLPMEISAWNNLGTFYSGQNDTANAFVCFTKSLELGSEFSNRDTQALALNNLGSVYDDMNDLEKARSFFEQSLILSQEIHDWYGIARAYNNLGVLFEKQGDLRQAIWHYTLAVDGLHEIADHFRETVAAINIASLYARSGDHTNARKWHTRGYRLADQFGYTDLLVSLAILDGDIHFSTNSNWESGCESYARACELALQSNSKSLPRVIEITGKRLGWLTAAGKILLCQTLLVRCGGSLKNTTPDFYNFLASNGTENDA